MSYLACGVIQIASGLPDVAKDRLGFLIARCALDAGINIALGHNIASPTLIYDIVGLAKRDENAESLLVYLLTGSPLRDTSDELISPYVVGLEDDPGSLEVNTAKLGSFFRCVLASPDIVGIELYVGEGYDDSYSVIHTTPDAFVERALNIFLPDPYIPSTRFILTRR